jgi:V/A-type H+/Na+-transporting ATPase subunit K
MRRLPMLLFVAAVAMFVAATLPSVFAASTNSTTTAITTEASSAGEKFLAAGIAFGLAAFGAGYGVGQSGAAAIAAVTEKAEVRTTALIFVVLAEAIAIYGFAIAILILGQSG